MIKVFRRLKGFLNRKTDPVYENNKNTDHVPEHKEKYEPHTTTENLLRITDSVYENSESTENVNG